MTAERRGRTLYEQNCQVCHGPDLKGDRGPRIDDAVSRLGADATRTVIAEGQGRMPPIASLTPPLLDDLIAFLTKPEAAPPGSAAPPALMGGGGRGEPPYPEGVTPPPSRYKTGYGNEPYVVHSAMEPDHGLRSEHRKDQMADALRRSAAGRAERQTAR